MLRLPEKGSEGYFEQKKKLNGIAAAAGLLLVLLIYATGLIVYHTNKSVFTVIAAVSVLPAAKAVVSFLILVPYHSATTEQCRQVREIVAGIRGVCILYDILLASEERSLIAGMIVVIHGNILMFTGDSKADTAATEKYVKKLLENCNHSSIKQYTSFEQFCKRLTTLALSEHGNQNQDENELLRQQTMCERIEKQIFIYTV